MYRVLYMKWWRQPRKPYPKDEDLQENNEKAWIRLTAWLLYFHQHQYKIHPSTFLDSAAVLKQTNSNTMFAPQTEEENNEMMKSEEIKEILRIY